MDNGIGVADRQLSGWRSNSLPFYEQAKILFELLKIEFSYIDSILKLFSSLPILSRWSSFGFGSFWDQVSKRSLLLLLLF
jgi:hypothetical protein